MAEVVNGIECPKIIEKKIESFGVKLSAVVNRINKDQYAPLTITLHSFNFLLDRNTFKYIYV